MLPVDCLKKFKICSSGISQVKSYLKLTSHMQRSSTSNQSTLIVSNGSAFLSKGGFILKAG